MQNLSLLKIILLGLGILIISCNRNKKNVAPEKKSVAIETPKVLLVNDKISSEIIKSRSGYVENLVEALFKEACSKDKNLNNLQKQISKEISEVNSLIFEFNDYKELTSRVLSSVKNQSQKIKNDSLLAKKIINLSLISKDKFQEKIKGHLSYEKEILSKKRKLENKLIELKILIALKMLKGFQDNEIPPKELLVQKSELLEQLLIQTQAAIKE